MIREKEGGGARGLREGDDPGGNHVDITIVGKTKKARHD